MIWSKLPKDARKAILAALSVLGGASVSCRIEPPIVCDPAPPPSVTPMLCDPPPLPSVTPMVCDPAPPPPIVTVAPDQHFAVETVEVSPNVNQSGVSILGTIVDQSGQPLAGLTVVIEREGQRVEVVSDYGGTFYYSTAEAGTYTLAIAGDETSRLTMALQDRDQATVEWVETWDGALVPLPLAEIRTVRIAWLDSLTFAAESPWPGARYRWSASGGTLVDGDGGMIWQPPTEPGRYLLQVVADWGRLGLAVDAVVLTVEDDGSVTSG